MGTPIHSAATVDSENYESGIAVDREDDSGVQG